MTGRSVHNQRIERFWRDLFTGCTNVYYALFRHLESEGILNPDDPTHVWGLHYVFETRIQADLRKFAAGWNNHNLSTERGKSPNQLFASGLVQNRGQEQTAIDDLFEETGVDEVYAIDWADAVPNNVAQAQRQIDVECPLNVQQLNELRHEIDPNSRSIDGFGIDIFVKVLAFCQRDVE